MLGQCERKQQGGGSPTYGPQLNERDVTRRRKIQRPKVECEPIEEHEAKKMEGRKRQHDAREQQAILWKPCHRRKVNESPPSV